MKKTFTIFLSVLLCACFALCSGCSKKLDLYDCGKEMTVQMEELIKSDFYADNSGLNVELKSIREDFIANDYDTPIKTYRIEMPNKMTLVFKLMDITETEWNEISPAVQAQILETISLQLAISRINIEMSSVNVFAFTNNYIITKQFDKYSLKAEVAYLYIFETGKPIIVTFTPCHNGITARAQFLTVVDKTSLSALRELFEPFDCTVTVLD